MSIVTIRKALEKHLLALTPAFPTATQNNAFTPTTGVPYQRIYLLPNTPDNAVQGARMYFERGVFQITLLWPTGGGSMAADTRAELLRNHFRRGTSLVESGVTVHVTNTPSIATALSDEDRYAVPVSVYWQAQINL